MKNRTDDEARRLTGEKSAGEILLSYGIALAFAAVAALAALAGRETIEAIACRIVLPMKLEANQYSGFLRLSTIGGLGLMALLWLGAFLIVWHRVERAESMRARLKVGACWTAGATLLCLAFALIQFAVAGDWPF